MGTYRRVLGSLAGSALLLAGLLLFLAHTGQTVRAAGAAFFVTPGGAGDCSQAAPCTLSTALAQAGEGDALYLGAGTYTGSGGAVITLTRSLNLYGGWDGAPSGAVGRDPRLHISLVDGENARRGVFISGPGIAVTLDGLQITRGNADGLDGRPSSDEDAAGGGIYVYTATLTVNDCRIYSNTAALTLDGYGGGIYAYGSQLTLTASTVESNTAGISGPYHRNYGGGVALEYSPHALLRGNRIRGNRAAVGEGSWFRGGGVSFLFSGYARVLSNTIQGNVACDGPAEASGGGMDFWYSPHALVQGNTFQDNLASTGADGEGGGLSIAYSPHVTVTGNTFVENTAILVARSSGYGGGLSAYSQYLLVEENTFIRNTAAVLGDGEGGGAGISGGDAVIRNNRFVDNTASRGAYGYGYGGGLDAQGDRNVITGNLFRGNVASRAFEGHGGGLYLSWSAHTTLAANTFLSNTATLSPTATGEGGGLMLHAVDALTLTNNLVAANQANTRGSGVVIWSNKWHPAASVWLHTTIADNRGGPGVFLSEYSTAAFTNTILSGHTVGITATLGSTATLNATLWDNATDWGGGGLIFTGMRNLWGDPAFASPAGYDYHLRGTSPAVDAGLDLGVATDMDGESRPQGSSPDLGADEFWPRLYLPLVMKP